MSTQSPFGGRLGRTYPTLPKGETIASYETYQEAQSAVDRLAKAEFPVKELSIVGHDLTTVERITGKLTWGRAAGAGALSGAWFGTFLGLLLFIFSPDALGILGAAILIGAGFGMIFGVVSYSLNRRRRDFTSVMQVLATRYAIIGEPQHVARARDVLGVTDAAAPAPVVPAAPTPAGTAPAQPTESPAEPVAGEPVAGEGDETGPSADRPAAAEPANDARPLTYGEAQDARRRAAREGRDAGEA
ncbi:general stress protein [Agromyces arachidis]|uniref:general stress protein n=1 Tax=Agromyces arachidis TaxID=766966 RepID=UPI004057B622